MQKTVFRRTMPMGDIYVGKKQGRWYYGWIRRQRTRKTELAYTRTEYLDALINDYHNRCLAQEECVQGKNPFYRPF